MIDYLIVMLSMFRFICVLAYKLALSCVQVVLHITCIILCLCYYSILIFYISVFSDLLPTHWNQDLKLCTEYSLHSQMLKLPSNIDFYGQNTTQHNEVFQQWHKIQWNLIMEFSQNNCTTFEMSPHFFSLLRLLCLSYSINCSLALSLKRVILLEC